MKDISKRFVAGGGVPYSVPLPHQQIQIQPKTGCLSEQDQIYFQYANFLQQPHLQSTLEHQLPQQQLQQLQNPAAIHMGGGQFLHNSIGKLKSFIKFQWLIVNQYFQLYAPNNFTEKCKKEELV